MGRIDGWLLLPSWHLSCISSIFPVYKLRIGLFPEQWAGGTAQDANSAPDYQRCDDRAGADIDRSLRLSKACARMTCEAIALPTLRKNSAIQVFTINVAQRAKIISGDACTGIGLKIWMSDSFVF